MAKWVVYGKRADFAAIAEKFHIDQVIARIIRNRDIVGDEAIDRFLNGTPADMYDPGLLKDARRAVEILADGIRDGKRMRVVGDYDIDGVCASYILLRGLRFLGADVDTVIPHRIYDGYGMNDRIITEAHEEGVDLLLTCDNGIAAAAQIDLAKSLGMTVIVTDHHEVPYEVGEDGARRELVPAADAVVDPKQEGCAYPFKEICGAVVAYKLMQLMLDGRRDGAAEALRKELFAFAAFATVGDVMELVDENRIIVKYGLRLIAETANKGMRALLNACGRLEKPLTAYDIGFILGPCINSTGRLDTARRALRMFDAEDEAEAAAIAGELKALNDSRKTMTLQGTQRAIQLIEESDLRNDRVLVVYLPDCHESLAGIIAGRVRERYGKPAFVLTDAEDGIKGSGRSIDAYHMFDKMSECRELYTKFGGHKMAAGFSMPAENMETFRRYLNEHCGLSDEDLTEKIRIDVPMPMSYVTADLVRQLDLLEPCGIGNRKPVFAQKNVRLIRGRVLGRNGNVGKYTVENEEGGQFEMIYFGDLERWHDFLRENFGQDACDGLYRGVRCEGRIHVVYYPRLDVYQGRERLQMVMEDYCRGD